MLHQLSRPVAYFYPHVCCRKIGRVVLKGRHFYKWIVFPPTPLFLQCVNSRGESSVKVNGGCRWHIKVLSTTWREQELQCLWLEVIAAAASPNAPIAASPLLSSLWGTLWHGLLPALVLYTSLMMSKATFPDSPRERLLHKGSALLLKLDHEVSFKIHRLRQVVGLIWG